MDGPRSEECRPVPHAVPRPQTRTRAAANSPDRFLGLLQP